MSWNGVPIFKSLNIGKCLQVKMISHCEAYGGAFCLVLLSSEDIFPFFGKFNFIYYFCINKKDVLIINNLTMTLKQELLLRCISSFIEEDGYAHYSHINMFPCRHERFKDEYKYLYDNKFIENYTKNGYYVRIKVLKPLECPDFIFMEILDLKLRLYLLELYNNYYNKQNLNKKVRDEARLRMLNLNSENLIKNAKIIKNKISTDAENYELVYTENGYKAHKKDNNTYKCRYCGDTNPDHFTKSDPYICKSCRNKIDRTLIPMSEKLLIRSKKSATARDLEYKLTTSDIEELLKNQNNKCYYTGLTFGDNFSDKFTYPTIDRIDSSKGYIKGNVCICTFIANIMKRDMTTDQFKEQIKLLYKNIDNF